MVRSSEVVHGQTSLTSGSPCLRITRRRRMSLEDMVNVATVTAYLKSGVGGRKCEDDTRRRKFRYGEDLRSKVTSK